MKFRKIKKEYMKMFGIRMMVKFYDKKHKCLINASKKATAYKMREALRDREPYLGFYTKAGKFHE